MYADDTTLHYANKDKNVLESKLQNGAATFNHWCISNDMFVNWLKTSLMMLGTRQNLSDFDLVDVYLESYCIQHVETQKLLCITIDKNLSWDKQIGSVCPSNHSVETSFEICKQNSLKLYYNSCILQFWIMAV